MRPPSRFYRAVILRRLELGPVFVRGLFVHVKRAKSHTLHPARQSFSPIHVTFCERPSLCSQVSEVQEPRPTKIDGLL